MTNQTQKEDYEASLSVKVISASIGALPRNISWKMTNQTRQENYEASLSVKVLSASIGALISTIVVTPLDVVKTRIQNKLYSGKKSKPLYKTTEGVVSIPKTSELLDRQILTRTRQQNLQGLSFTWQLRDIMRSEGLAGLFSGLRPAVVGTVPSTMVYMVMYDQMSEYLKPQVGIVLAPLLTGAASRTFITVVSNPLELLKVRLQAVPKGGSLESKLGLTGLVQKVFAEEGVAGLWRGTWITLIRDVPYSMIYWCSYESAKHRLSRIHNGYFKEFPVPVAFAAGAGSALLSTFFTHPFDVVKTKQQVVSQSQNGNKVPSMLSIGKRIWREEGLRGLTLGLSPRLIRTIPASAIMISSYEFGKSFFS